MPRWISDELLRGGIRVILTEALVVFLLILLGVIVAYAAAWLT